MQHAGVRNTGRRSQHLLRRHRQVGSCFFVSETACGQQLQHSPSVYTQIHVRYTQDIYIYIYASVHPPSLGPGCLPENPAAPWPSGCSAVRRSAARRSSGGPAEFVARVVLPCADQTQGEHRLSGVRTGPFSYWILVWEILVGFASGNFRRY